MKANKRFFISLGDEGEDGQPDFWIHGAVKAANFDKAFKKARRIQLNTGWPFLRVEPTPRGTNTDRRFERRVARKEKAPE